MRLLIAVLLISCCVKHAFGQRNGSNSSYPQKMPDKDPVMVMEQLGAGKIKTYNWRGNRGKVRLESTSSNNRMIELRCNGKLIPYNNIAENEQSIKSIYLPKKNNIMVVSVNKNYRGDSCTAELTLSEPDISYKITAHLKKGLNDTIILKRSFSKTTK